MPDHPLCNIRGRSTRCARVNLIDLAHCDVRLAVRHMSKTDAKPSGEGHVSKLRIRNMGLKESLIIERSRMLLLANPNNGG